MVAAVLVRDANGRITAARVAVGACSAVAQRLARPRGGARGAGSWRPGSAASSGRTTSRVLSPIDDVRGSAAYRLEAAEVLVRRALEELAS